MGIEQVKTMRANRLRSGHPQGFTLMELVIVVGVIGFILGAVWYAAANAHESQRDTDGINELQTVVQNILNLMDGQTFQTTTAPPTYYTSNFINSNSQAIPSSYVNVNAPSTVDNPWNSGASGGHTGFQVGIPTTKTFRLSFYNVSYQGCLALLLNAVSCQAGQAGCPIEVYTAYAEAGTSTMSPTAAGWSAMTVSAAQTMCNANSYSGGVNSVEFDYSL